MGWVDGYLRPDQFLDHLAVIIKGVRNFQQIKTKEKVLSGESWIVRQRTAQEGLLWKRCNFWTTGLVQNIFWPNNGLFIQEYLKFSKTFQAQVRTTLRKEGIILEAAPMNLLLKVKVHSFGNRSKSNINSWSCSVDFRPPTWMEKEPTQ